MAEEVKLIGMWASPFSRRIELALKLKGIQYEYIEEDLSNKSPLLLNYNPVHEKVPVLVHNGKPLAESLVILEYIDETWPNNPILPQDPHDRAMARFWAKFADEKMLPTAMKAITDNEKEKEQARLESSQQLKLVENELKDKEFFGGETIGYLDIVIFFIVYYFKVWQEVLQRESLEERFPVLYKWLGKLLDIDLIKGCLPSKDKHVTRIRARLEATKSASK